MIQYAYELRMQNKMIEQKRWTYGMAPVLLKPSSNYVEVERAMSMLVQR